MANVKKFLKYGTIAGLAIATYLGTMRNNSGLPFIYNHITRDSSGICLGIFNNIEEGVEFQGIVGSPINKNAGRIKGVSVGVFNTQVGLASEVIGIEAALANWRWNTSSVQTAYGMQIGVYNENSVTDKCVRIGF